MKIVFFISVLGEGIGGHTYSLKTTADALSEDNECIIITIGRNKTPVLDSVPFKKYPIVYRSINPLKILDDIEEILLKEKPDVLHAFDMFSFFFTRVISQKLQIPCIMTKCGGPDPKLFFPSVDNLILYTIENQEYFEKHQKFENTNVFLIPNRIKEIFPDTARIEKIKKLFPKNTKILLRIARLGEVYKKGIFQTIRLVNRLNSEEIKVIFLLIGSIENQQSYEEIESMRNSNIYIITDPEFTLHANQLIDVADIVMGTGRGFMEAASCKKIMLCPLAQSEYPLLVTDENFLEVFGKNFSERTIVKFFDPDINYSLIKKALSEKCFSDRLMEIMSDKSDNFFLIKTQLKKYKWIYENLEFRKDKNYIDYFVHLLVILYFDYRYGKLQKAKQ